VRLIKGEGFPALDSGKQINAFLKIGLGDKEIKTEVVDTTGDKVTAYWWEEIYLPINLPCVNVKLVLSFFDEDTIGGDDMFGNLFFLMKDI